MSTYTIDQLTKAMNEPVVHPTEPRRSKLEAINRMRASAAVAVELASIAKKIHQHYEKVETPLKFVKSPSYSPKEHTKRRFTTDAKEDIKGLNGHFIRIAINKESRKVYMVNVTNWPKESIVLFKERFPTGLAVKAVRAVKAVKVVKAVVNPISLIVKDIRQASKTRRKNMSIKKKSHSNFKRSLKKSRSDLKKKWVIDKRHNKHVIRSAKATEALGKEMERRKKFDVKFSPQSVRC